MATTYDLSKVSSPAASALTTGDIINCPYTGSYKTITLPKGTYKLECWGAQGGNYNSSYVGGKGGYSYGTLTLTKNTSLFLYAGGQGTKTSDNCGGFNGGGSVTCYSDYGSGGGGASDIRIGQDSLYARVIVAGGGGGSGYSTASISNGYGGGSTGGTGSYYSRYGPGYGGTQTAGGSSTISRNMSNSRAAGFGVGGSTTSSNPSGGWTGGGGGGGWYGGGAGGAISDGGGGSGYVLTSSSSKPSGYLLNSEYYLTDTATIAGNASFTDYSGATTTGHSGNGAIKITVLNITPPKGVFIKTNSTTWNKAKSIFIKIDANTWIEKSF